MGWAREFDSSGRPIMSNEEYSSRLRTYSPPTAQIHISFRAMKPFPLNEAYLREIFQTFGEVIDVVIKKVQLRPVRVSLPLTLFPWLISIFFFRIIIKLVMVSFIML